MEYDLMDLDENEIGVFIHRDYWPIDEDEIEALYQEIRAKYPDKEVTIWYGRVE